MIHKNLLLAFLALQSSSNPRTSKDNAASEVAIQLNVLIELETTFPGAEVGTKKSIHGIDYLSTPGVQTSGNDAQVPIKIPSGHEVVIQRGSRIINFNDVPPGFSDPSKVSFPDGFQVLAQTHSYNLKDAFPSIKPPLGISRVWGAYPAGGHFEVFFSRARGTVKNVSIQFGWIENGALTPGSYTSQIWKLRFRGWDVVNGPSGSFNGSDWETTTTIVASGDRFVFDFSGGPSDKVLVVSTVFYDLSLGEGLRRA